MTSPPAPNGTLSDLLKQAARRFPDAPAVVDSGRTITYQELARQSASLGSWLIHAGIGPGDRVGIHLPRGLEACIAIFATLQIRAIYVPLDPSGPAARNRRIADNCSLAALVSSTGKAETLIDAGDASPIGTTILVGNEEQGSSVLRSHPEFVSWNQALEGPEALSNRFPSPSDLAYILYTSGSTGDPKGVMVTHGAARAFVDWARETLGLVPKDRIAGVASHHFDLSIFDLFATCAAGACHLPLPADAWLHPRSTAQRLVDDQITTWYSTPSTLMLLLAQGHLEEHSLPSLRRILFAGEVFPRAPLRQLQNLLPQTEFFNLYGPTETNVCTWHPVPAVDARAIADLPIGEPCSGTRARVADLSGSEVPPGQVGELWVSGPTLSQGYWRDPRRTAVTLVPAAAHDDSRESSSGARWYRTGDLVHRDADGKLHFHGRRDFMVKLRGYRIEIGEIEAALYDHPLIAETAVARTGNDRSNHRLTAWIVPRKQEQISILALKLFLGKKIPPYMIPAEFFFRDSLPRTSTGKLDRRALTESREA